MADKAFGEYEGLEKLKAIVLQENTSIEQKNKRIDSLSKFEDEKAYFAPKLNAIRLTPPNWQVIEQEPSLDLINLLKSHDFYQIQISTLLYPRSGYDFTRLECNLKFCPNEPDSNFLPTIHELFPNQNWTELFRFSPNLKISLDSNLRFQVETPKLTEKNQAKIQFNAESGLNLLLSPFTYSFGRPEITTTGQGTSECYWRLEGRKNVAEYNAHFALILMVPKTRTIPIDVLGELRVYHDFQIWTADIFKDWLPAFSHKLKNWWKSGRAIHASQEWKDITNASRFSAEQLVRELHDPDTGRVNSQTIIDLLGLRKENNTDYLANFKKVFPEKSNSSESLDKLYIFIKDALILIESGYDTYQSISRDNMIIDFRLFLNAPNPLLNSRSPMFYVLNKDFRTLNQYLENLRNSQ